MLAYANTERNKDIDRGLTKRYKEREREETMTPDGGLTVLEMYVWFGAFLALMIAGVAFIGWWRMRG